MPIFGPLFSALLVLATIVGMTVTTQNWSQQRNAALYADIDSDIQQTLREYETWKRELAAAELRAPPPAAVTTGSAAAQDDAKARKAQTSSIKKRATGKRRERFVPPDFARLPITIARTALGFGMWR